LRTDLDSVWAQWIDREVVVDRGLMSSRKPANVPAFNLRMIE
jgi:protease I